MEKNIYENLSHLGTNSELPRTPSEATLEAVPNPHQKTNYLVRFTAPEFTSLCPVTKQADFAHFDSFDGSTTIPDHGLDGRTVSSGYAQKLGFTDCLVVKRLKLPAK